MPLKNMRKELMPRGSPIRIISPAIIPYTSIDEYPFNFPSKEERY
jgi:hypothetical protein